MKALVASVLLFACQSGLTADDHKYEIGGCGKQADFRVSLTESGFFPALVFNRVMHEAPTTDDTPKSLQSIWSKDGFRLAFFVITPTENEDYRCIWLELRDLIFSGSIEDYSAEKVIETRFMLPGPMSSEFNGLNSVLKRFQKNRRFYPLFQARSLNSEGVTAIVTGVAGACSKEGALIFSDPSGVVLRVTESIDFGSKDRLGFSPWGAEAVGVPFNVNQQKKVAERLKTSACKNELDLAKWQKREISIGGTSMSGQAVDGVLDAMRDPRKKEEMVRSYQEFLNRERQR